MKVDRGKLEKWITELPECREFLENFFSSCQDDPISACVNYRMDMRSYSATHEAIRSNCEKLLAAFEDIAGMVIYHG